jgi:hypothetical protein
MDLPGGLGTSFCESLKEAPAVVLEDGFAAVATVHDMVDGAGVLDAELAGHVSRLRGGAESVNRKSRTTKRCGSAGHCHDPVTSRHPREGALFYRCWSGGDFRARR